MDSYYKVRQLFLLQSGVDLITNCNMYYKELWIYCKLRQVLQSAMIIHKNWDSTSSTLYAFRYDGLTIMQQAKKTDRGVLVVIFGLIVSLNS